MTAKRKSGFEDGYMDKSGEKVSGESCWGTDERKSKSDMVDSEKRREGSRVHAGGLGIGR